MHLHTFARITASTVRATVAVELEMTVIARARAAESLQWLHAWERPLPTHAHVHSSPRLHSEGALCKPKSAFVDEFALVLRPEGRGWWVVLAL